MPALDDPELITPIPLPGCGQSSAVVQTSRDVRAHFTRSFNQALPGAIVIGGVLGRQIASGRGNDAATAGGAVAGAAIGASVDRGYGGQAVYGQERCATAPRDARPDYL